MRLVEFSLAHRIPVACFSCHKINKISISWLNYNRKQEILLKNLPQNQSNLKANGIYSCTGIYFFKSAFIFIYLKSLQKTRQNHDILQRLLYFVWNSLFLSKLMKTISRIAPLLRNFRNPANTSYHFITEEVKVHPG